MKYQKGACLAGCALDDARMATWGKQQQTTTKYRDTNISSCSNMNNMTPPFCKQLIKTLKCDGHGQIDINSIFKQESSGSGDCETVLATDESGYCVCADGSKKGYADCGHQPFSCNQICQPNAPDYSYTAPKWNIPDYKKWTVATCSKDSWGCENDAYPGALEAENIFYKR